MLHWFIHLFIIFKMCYIYEGHCQVLRSFMMHCMNICFWSYYLFRYLKRSLKRILSLIRNVVNGFSSFLVFICSQESNRTPTPITCCCLLHKSILAISVAASPFTALCITIHQQHTNTIYLAHMISFHFNKTIPKTSTKNLCWIKLSSFSNAL